MQLRTTCCSRFYYRVECGLQLPDKDEFSQSKRQMLARIDVCMGGKVAEEVIFGRDAVTSGARSDLQQATSLARHMVAECGMSDELGESSNRCSD